MAEDDPVEVVELERMADLRIKKLGESSSDAVNAAAAKPLQRLAERAHVFRTRIGIGQFPASGEDYLRVLTGFTKARFGT
jgi:hypothetical protein